MRAQLSRWLQPAPDSLAAQEARSGHPPWTHFVHLVWSVWVFLTPAFSGGAYGFTPRWRWSRCASRCCRGTPRA